jgi:hypothetical protein
MSPQFFSSRNEEQPKMGSLKRAFVAVCLCLPSTFSWAQASQPAYRVLDGADLQKMTKNGGATGVLLDLNLMRLDDGALKDRDFFDYFVRLNNCGNRKIVTEPNNEFDYPSIQAFYREKASEILRVVPATVSARTTGFQLGEYDRRTGSFPIQISGKDTLVQFDRVTPIPNRNIAWTCPEASGQAADRGPSKYIRMGRKPVYQITFSLLTFTKVGMDEASARKYVEGLSSQDRGRSVDILIDVDIVQQPPQLGDAPKDPRDTTPAKLEVTFRGEVKKVSLVKFGTLEPVATLYP